jgi:putative PIN family toxin of toxin-antitoxin system
VNPSASKPLPSGVDEAVHLTNGLVYDAPSQHEAAARVVIDTNIVLDLLVFADPHCADLRAGIDGRTLQWLATPAMREELWRVLDYPQLQPRLAFYGLVPAQVMAAFDARATLCLAAPKAPCTCKDPDDQKFIDLAVAQRACLLSKDKAVLAMRKRLERLGVEMHLPARA